MFKRLSFLFLLMSLFLISLSAQEVEELSLENPRLRGDNVVRLQKMLLFYGYDLGSWGADGIFGPATEEALRNYQFDYAMHPNGRFYVDALPQELVWDPYVEEYHGEAPSPVAHGGDGLLDNQDSYSSSYGSVSIPPVSWDFGDRCVDYRISPGGRFLAFKYYNPQSDVEAGQPVYIYDLLLQDYFSIYPINIRNIPDEQAWEEMRNPHFSEVYWTEEGKLFLSVQWSDGQGSSYSENFQVKVQKY